VIFLSEKAQWLREFQKRAVEDREWRRALESYGGDEILELFNKRYEKRLRTRILPQLKTFSYFLKFHHRKWGRNLDFTFFPWGFAEGSERAEKEKDNDNSRNNSYCYCDFSSESFSAPFILRLVYDC
jgi:hypothetical protein